MTFILPNLPSPQADTSELADFAELLCWIRGSTSKSYIVAYLGRIDDNDINSGCDDDEDKNAEVLDEVMNEIERRESACNSGYPFTLDPTGTVLKFDSRKLKKTQSVVYLYLLLSTRLNMKSNRTHASINGTQLLERLSAFVLKSYLGTSKAKSLVFGTSNQGSFQDKVDDLCLKLREGSGFCSLDDAPVQAKDDKLDTVAWVPFVDRLPGQLIVFGQCKTGTSWHDSITQLQPENFIKKWMRKTFLVNPLRAFCVSEAADRARWKGFAVSAGILFDRCRLVEFSDGLSGTTLSDIRNWTLAAKKTTGLG